MNFPGMPIDKNFRKHFRPGDVVTVALSGGADSVALLYALLALRTTVPLTVCAAHVNHNMRAASASEETFVRELCASHHVPLRVFSVTVDPPTENEARRLRYECLAHAAKEQAATRIATAHNQNDNAETLLLHLLRGTGLSGLGGIPTERLLGDVPLVRPLLHVPRTAIEAYLNRHSLTWRTDESNADTRFTRNRIRRDVLPVLSELNPQFVAHAARTAAILREDGVLLDALAETLFRECAGPKGLHIPTLAAAPVPLQKRVLRLLAQPAPLNHAQTEHALRLLSGENKALPLPDGRRLVKEYEHLQCLTVSDAVFRYELVPDTEPLYLAHAHLAITATVSPYSEEILSNRYTKHFNYDRIAGVSVMVRGRLPGDRIRTAQGRKKIQNEFTDRKIPKRLRDTLPLLAWGPDGEVLWILPSDAYEGRVSTAFRPVRGCRVMSVGLSQMT